AAATRSTRPTSVRWRTRRTVAKARRWRSSARQSGAGSMTSRASFSVEQVFDIPQRAGLLALGRVLHGVISKGMVLHDEATGARTTVLGIELIHPPETEPGRMTLLLERTEPTPVVQGRVLTSVS